MYKVICLSNDISFIESVSQNASFEICGIVSNCIETVSRIRLFCEALDIPFRCVNTKTELEKAINSIDSEFGLMYSFKTIVPSSIIAKFDIYNFHPGSLKTNRGPTPISWSICLNESQTELSLHKISQDIDLGELVASKIIDISETDNTISLKIKIIKQIPCVLEELIRYLNGEKNTTTVIEGIYRKHIEKQDYTIDITKDSLEIIAAKIRSQVEYYGAIVLLDGHEVRVKTMEEYYLKIKRMAEDK